MYFVLCTKTFVQTKMFRRDYIFTTTGDMCICDNCNTRFDVLTGDRTDFCPTCLAMFAVNRAMLRPRAHESVFATSVPQTDVYFIVDERPKNTYCLRKGCTQKTTARGGFCSLHRCGNCKGPNDGRSTMCDKCKGSIPVYYSSFW